MVFAGISHFRSPEPFISIVPKFLPDAPLLVSISGFFEILGAVGLLIPFTRKAASIGLILLYIAVFPANINMAVHNLPIENHHFPLWVLWLRLPLQLLLIVWAAWCGTLTRKQFSTSAGILAGTDE